MGTVLGPGPAAERESRGVGRATQ